MSSSTYALILHTNVFSLSKTFYGLRKLSNLGTFYSIGIWIKLGIKILLRSLKWNSLGWLSFRTVTLGHFIFKFDEFEAIFLNIVITRNKGNLNNQTIIKIKKWGSTNVTLLVDNLNTKHFFIREKQNLKKKSAFFYYPF